MGPAWISATLADHYAIDKSNTVQARLDFRRAEDNLYFGIGPDVTSATQSRYGLEKVEASLSYHAKIPGRESRLQFWGGIHRLTPVEGTCCNDPSVHERINMGQLMEPPGFSETYTAAFAAMDMMLDSRSPRPSSGSGAFLHLWGQPNLDIQRNSAWVQYGGAVGGAVDLTGKQRVFKMQLAVSMLDQIRGTAPVPFTEYLIFDGDMWRASSRAGCAARARRQPRSATRGRSGSASTARPGSRSATHSASTSPASAEQVPLVLGHRPHDEHAPRSGIRDPVRPRLRDLRAGRGHHLGARHRRLAARILMRQPIFPLLFLAATAAACSHGKHPFPLRDPFVVDTDMHPVSVPCHPDPTKDDPHAQTCAPGAYVSPFIWDQVDNLVFARISRGLKLETHGEARNVNSMDEVPDSAWFTNKKITGPEDKAPGACDENDMLPAPDDVQPGEWVINHGKDNGSTLGFRVNIKGKGKYMLKADDEGKPERATAASVIGAALYDAIGFNTSCEQIVSVKKDMLKLTPGLVVIDNGGISHPFDEAALDKVLKSTTQLGNGLVRMQASKWLPGYTIGPFRYVSTRDDDPNNVIDHANRRELRGSRVLAAWLDHWDAREQNSMDVWLATDKEKKKSSPGFVKHYILDTSDTLGEEVTLDDMSRRLGYAYEFDIKDIAARCSRSGPTRSRGTAPITSRARRSTATSRRPTSIPSAGARSIPTPRSCGRPSATTPGWPARSPRSRRRTCVSTSSSANGPSQVTPSMSTTSSWSASAGSCAAT